MGRGRSTTVRISTKLEPKTISIPEMKYCMFDTIHATVRFHLCVMFMFVVLDLYESYQNNLNDNRRGYLVEKVELH